MCPDMSSIICDIRAGTQARPYNVRARLSWIRNAGADLRVGPGAHAGGP
jgi:hypothetical protein